MNTHTIKLALSMILVLICAACGGGDDGPEQCLNGIIYQDGVPKEAFRNGEVATIQAC